MRLYLCDCVYVCKSVYVYEYCVSVFVGVSTWSVCEHRRVCRRVCKCMCGVYELYMKVSVCIYGV